MIALAYAITGGRFPKSNKLRVEPNKLSDPVDIKKVLGLVQRSPPITWSIPVDEHYFAAATTLTIAATHAFQPTTRCPYKPYTSESTCAIVCLRKFIHSDICEAAFGRFDGLPWPLFQWGLDAAIAPYHK